MNTSGFDLGEVPGKSHQVLQSKDTDRATLAAIARQAIPPGNEQPGHFGLVVKDYTHSTAPNRRFPDLMS